MPLCSYYFTHVFLDANNYLNAKHRVMGMPTVQLGLVILDRQCKRFGQL